MRQRPVAHSQGHKKRGYVPPSPQPTPVRAIPTVAWSDAEIHLWHVFFGGMRTLPPAASVRPYGSAWTRRGTSEARPHNIFTSFITWIGNRPDLQLRCL
jgi:hypothetical protein